MLKKKSFHGYSISKESKPISHMFCFILSEQFIKINFEYANKFLSLLVALFNAIEVLKNQHGFSSEYDLLYQLEELIEWIPAYKNSNKNTPRVSSIKKNLDTITRKANHLIKAYSEIVDLKEKLETPIGLMLL